MRHFIIAVFLCLALFFQATLCSAADFYTVDVDRGSSLNMREKPGTSARKVGKLYNGTCLQSLGETTNKDKYNWLKVKTASGKTGWVAVDFIKKSGGDCFKEKPAPKPEPKPEPEPKPKPEPEPVTPITFYNVLIGGFASGEWKNDEPMMPLVQRDASLNFYSLDRAYGEGVLKYVYEGEVCLVDAEVDGLPDDIQTPAALFGVGGDWNALPRAPQVQSTEQDYYKNEIRRILANKGLDELPIKITQLFRLDLEGDGREEVLITATDVKDKITSDPADYSLVVLRKVVGEQVQTFVLSEEYGINKPPEEIPYWCAVDAVLDLNGDGKQEIITGCEYYEGGSLFIFEVDGGDVRQVIDHHCGV